MEYASLLKIFHNLFKKLLQFFFYKSIMLELRCRREEESIVFKTYFNLKRVYKIIGQSNIYET